MVLQWSSAGFNMVYNRVRKDRWSQYAGVGAFGKRKTQPQGLGFHVRYQLNCPQWPSPPGPSCWLPGWQNSSRSWDRLPSTLPYPPGPSFICTQAPHDLLFRKSQMPPYIPPTQISYGEPARLKPGGAYGGADKMSFLFAQTLGCILLQDTRRWGIPLPFFSIWIVAKSHEPCAGQQLVPYTMAATSRTRHRFPMREPAKARASGKDRFPHLFSSLKKTGFPLSSRR